MVQEGPSSISITNKASGIISYLNLQETDYAFRIKTLSLFDSEGQKSVAFDIFVVPDDMRLKEFRLFDNLWKETLLLFHLRKHSDKVVAVKNFGQLPSNLIYREVDELSGITLEHYI
jgi:hypothetical protein